MSAVLRFANRMLGRLGCRLRLEPLAPALPSETVTCFRGQIERIRRDRPEFAAIEEYRDESQAHPMHYRDYECEFASEQIARLRPSSILDVGSYRAWLAGVMAHYPVTTLDVRARHAGLSNETIVTQDVRDLDLAPGSVDMVTTLHTIEHFGLGRYGDEFDPEGDRKAIASLLRVIRPGGHFLFSVPVTAGQPCIAFNSHRIYSMDMVREWVPRLRLVDEIFIKRKPARRCTRAELAAGLGEFDVYCGCYSKTQAVQPES